MNTKIIEELLAGNPVRKTWWFEDDYIIFNTQEKKLIRRWADGKQDECDNEALRIIMSMRDNPEEWEVMMIKRNGE